MNQQYGRFGSLAALIGGSMWMVYYCTDLISGAMGNRIIEHDPLSSPLTITSMLLFNLAIIAFNLANVGLFQRLNGRSRGWGIAGLSFAGLAVAMITASFIATATGLIRGGIFSGIGVMATCIATTLLGIGVLRARALPGKARFLPLALGALTFPFIVTITIILGAFLPDYAISEFPFAASGLGWIAIGVAMRVGAVRMEARRGALVTA
jgi:hypothetical protein